MTMNSILKQLMLRESLKKQVNRAQMKEILGHISDLLFENYTKLDWNPEGNVEATNWMDIVLYNNGAKRRKKFLAKVKNVVQKTKRKYRKAKR